MYNDPRIPIIRRYADHWATKEAAKRTATGWRKDAYSRGVLTRPSKYDYNAVNSSRRNPKAPRGRWNSVSQSVQPEGKGKKARCAEKESQDVRTTSPETSGQSGLNNINIDTINHPSLILPLPGPSESLDAGPSQSDPHGDFVDPSGM